MEAWSLHCIEVVNVLYLSHPWKEEALTNFRRGW